MHKDVTGMSVHWEMLHLQSSTFTVAPHFVISVFVFLNIFNRNSLLSLSFLFYIMLSTLPVILFSSKSYLYECILGKIYNISNIRDEYWYSIFNFLLLITSDAIYHWEKELISWGF